MGRNLDLHGSHTTLMFIATGVSNAVRIEGDSKQISKLFQYVSGGTLYWHGTSNVPANGLTLGWLVGSTQVLTFNGPAAFWLSALGSTVVVQVATGYSQGY